MTTHIRRLRSEVQLGVDDGLGRLSVVNLDDVTTIPKASLQRRAGSLQPDKLRAVSAALHYVLALDD